MQMFPMFHRLIACIAIATLAACSTPGTAPSTTPRTEGQTSQADRLAREGKHQEAAKIYEALAAQSPGELRDRLLLRAARQYLQGDATERASVLLTQISARLPAQDFVLRQQIAAELALRAQRPDKALTELNLIPQPLPQESLADILGLRARALFGLNRPAAGVIAALDREKALDNPEAQRANQRLIWEGLQSSASANADFTVPAGASTVVAGWLDLGRAALMAARNPFTAKEDLANWRTKYPMHPANSFLNDDILPELGVGLEYPPQIALVLPVSGRAQSAGIAVRDGFLAALLQQDPARRPMLNVYDTAAMGATTAYRKAITDGAQFIVGPLTKEDVTAIAASGDASVLTLALNQLADGAPAPPALLFQFALDPEEEARQVAQRVTNDGRMRGLVLLPNNDWGQRVFRAFDAELKTLGGSIAGMRFYDPSARDYSEPIRQLLLIDESRARANALNTTLGMRLEFEPRRRGDAQFVFVGAQPVQGRSLRPALRFHLSQDLPMYSTSEIFEPDAQANADLDGVLFPHMPWVISPDAASTQLRTAIGKYWPVRARSQGRLFAFGFDAYRIIPLLKAGRFGSAHAIPGMTGLLSIDDKGRVHRQLDWARVTNGQPVPLGMSTAASALP
ncbi:MAG: penicillin-binding protein activator [Steroidobacteraceae bacterium]